MNNKGFTLIEIIISVALISVVMLFLFQLLTDVEFESSHPTYAKENQVVRASVMRSVQQDLTSKPLKSVSMNGSHTKIYFEFQDGVNILSKTLSLTDRELTYGDEKWELQGTDVVIDVENILVESTSSENDELCEEVTNSELQITERHCPSYKYMKITIPIINGGEDNVIDDIELFYIGESTIFVPNYSLRTYFLKYDKDEGSEILVNRRSTTQNEIASLGTIHESNEIYPGDQLKIDLSPKENYVLDEYSIEGYEEFKNGDTIVVDRNVVVKARSHVPEYQLKISQGTGTTITVNRSFSIKGGKGILHQGDPIYQGDQLIISVSANTAAYNTPVLMVNNGAFTSGAVYTVSNPIDNVLSISSSATVKEYTLTKTQGDGTTLTIQRTASPIGKGILGDLENNAKIYYNDTLKVTVSAKTGYKDAKIVAGGTSLNSGGVKTITGNLAISSSASKITYNVTYNANGGSGAPGAQTKVYGTNLTLSSTKPTRTGYTFMNWNTKADGKGTSYNAGASYSANAALNLYAIYNPNTYSISYNLDGGSYGENYPTSATYDTAFTVNNPTKNGHTFTGWNITGMDSVTHNFGSSTTTNTSINGTKATSFKNLRATSGTVTFTAEWEPDRQNQCFLLAGKGTGKNGTDLSAANYAYDYEGGGGIIFPRTDALGMWFELNPYATATQIDFRWKGASNSPNTWYSASRYKPSSSIRGYKGPYTIEVYEAGHVGEYQYLQDTVIIKGIWESDDRYYGTWSCEHGKSGSAFLD